MKWWICVVVIVTILGITVAEDNVNHNYQVVNTKYGPVKGIKLLSKYDGKEFYSYKGIPYAKPPLGELRYKPPVAHDGWKEPLEAMEFGNACSQIAEKLYVGDQDCLTLNIYAPVHARNATVMFFIHGGSYIDGSSDDFFYGPDFLINENVILVTTNYRLGAHGFASLGTTDIAGNMGLKDMIFALKWVNENILNFGGDSKKITIFGHSSGGSATHLLTLSPKTEGLFQRAIIMSGCAYNPFALGNNLNHTSYLYKLAEEMDHPVKDYDGLLNFLRKADPEQLISKSTVTLESIINDGKFEFLFGFSPLVEHEHSTDPVFTHAPESYVTNDFRQDVDLMFGYTTGETLFQMAPIAKDPSILRDFNRKFVVDLPRRDLLDEDEDKPAFQTAQSQIKNYYFGTNEINLTQLDKVVDLTSDIIFRYGIEKAVEAESERRGKTFYYSFSGVGGLNSFSILLNVTELGIQKPSHADELCYLFSCKVMENAYPKFTPESKERQMIKNIASTFANFAKNGEPKSSNRNVEWKPVKDDEKNIVELGTDGNTAHVNPLKDMREFWDKLLDEYKRNLIQPVSSDRS